MGSDAAGRVTHPLYVESQIEFGLDEAGYGYWGFSPSSNPAGGYREYGVDAIGMEPNGYAADVGPPDARGRWLGRPELLSARRPPISDYGQGVVTPHAAFLALDFAPEATLENLANLAADFPGLYGRGGFKDAVNVATGQVADRYLSLDQGMVMAALANELTGDAPPGLPGADAGADAPAAHGHRGVRGGSHRALVRLLRRRRSVIRGRPAPIPSPYSRSRLEMTNSTPSARADWEARIGLRSDAEAGLELPALRGARAACARHPVAAR